MTNDTNSPYPPPPLPVPDPTVLTTEAMSRRITERGVLVDAQLAVRDARLDAIDSAGLARVKLAEAILEGVQKTLLERIDGATHQIEERLRAIDKAADLLAVDLRKVPSDLQLAVTSVNALNDVKFAAVHEALAILRTELSSRFELLDKQTVREKAAADLAVNAAFAAADKAAAAAAAASTQAISKSEAATAETIKTNATAMIAGNQALADKIDDARDRTNRIENLVITMQTQRSTQHDSRSEIKSSTSLGIGAVGLLVAAAAVVITVLATRSTPPTTDVTSPANVVTVTATPTR